MQYIKHIRAKIYLLILPAFLFYTLYVVLPELSNIVLSFFKWDGVSQIEFTGMANWLGIFSDSDFWMACKNTFIIFAGIFLIMIPLAYTLAVILSKKIRGGGMFRFLYFAPIVISPIMIALVWSFILDPSFGLLNSALRGIGLDALALNWIGGTVLSPYSIAFICIWQWTGINVVIYMSGIKAIPQSIFEAAAIDGSSNYQTAMRITLPLIKEQLVASAVLNVVGVLKVYEIVVALTGGGPGHYSETIGSYMMTKMFSEMQFGYGVAISVVISIVCILLSALLIKINNKETYEF